MSWNTSVVTNAGVDLLNESLAGHTLTIESAVGGAVTVTGWSGRISGVA